MSTSNHQILIVEDEIKIAQVLCEYLERAGYDVSCLRRGDEVIPQVKKNPPALILLDIMLPGMDGMGVCRELRKSSSIPIIMITARVDEIDRLLGLELGADDYVCKPFSPREVVARVKAVLRRIQPRQTEVQLTVGEISLDEEKHQVLISGKEVKLTPCEFQLLKALLAHPNRVFSRSELLNLVQGYDFEGYDRTIDTHIKNLRKKVATMAPGQELVSTVYGIGYKFSCPDE
jgi:two-component system, OmpR family, response regulator BaeR